MLREISTVLERLALMRERAIWPHGPRYLWTDAFGVVLLVSLYRELDDPHYLHEARWLVDEVDRVLGRDRGVRIGEASDRDGQYFHYLAMWIYALDRLGTLDVTYRDRALELVREIHPRFVRPGVGVYWKMEEDLSGPYPGFGLGALDPFHGLVVYRLLDSRFETDELTREIREMEDLVDQSVRTLHVTQDLGVGMMLWISHFAPDEAWARLQRHRCLEILEDLWIDPPGYFCRQPGQPDTRFAFTNYGVSIGLQATHEHLERVERLHRYFDTAAPDGRENLEAISHVMACSSLFPGELLTEGWSQPV